MPAGWRSSTKNFHRNGNPAWSKPFGTSSIAPRTDACITRCKHACSRGTADTFAPPDLHDWPHVRTSPPSGIRSAAYSRCLHWRSTTASAPRMSFSRSVRTWRSSGHLDLDELRLRQVLDEVALSGAGGRAYGVGGLSRPVSGVEHNGEIGSPMPSADDCSGSSPPTAIGSSPGRRTQRRVRRSRTCVG